MAIRDLKYLLAYIIPCSGFLAIYSSGVWTFSTLILAFGIIPFLERFLPGTTTNHTDEENREASIFFDWLLYLNIPLLYVLTYLYFNNVLVPGLPLIDQLGMTISVGIVIGSNGINVAHELGHRNNYFERFLSKSLLLLSLYQHFIIEHNLGHHKNVATDLDPASAKKGQTIYNFWIQSLTESLKDAWKIESNRLKKLNLSSFSFANRMVQSTIVQFTYLIVLGFFFGIMVIPFALAIALIGVLLLETINYIEHYGLRRKLMTSGRYEKVLPKHSWNSNHELGRILLYELTRHSDHHYKSTRKYQVLRNLDSSPQLPYGYPGSMLLTLVPPLWFKYIDPLIE